MKRSAVLILMILICFTQKIITNIPNNKPAGHESKKYIKLKNPVIHFLDGVHGCLDANAIADMFSIKKKIQDLKYGIHDKKTDTYHGKFTYMNQPASISMLIKFEEEIEKNPNQPNAEQKKHDLDKCLKEARTDFIQATLYFMDKIKGAKGLVMKLITESCVERGIKHTLLLEWANTNGNEEAYFNSKIKTIKEFDIFLTHVTDFLGDLITSCEIGFAEFKILQKKQKNATRA